MVSVSVHILANNALRALTPVRMVAGRLRVYQILGGWHGWHNVVLLL